MGAQTETRESEVEIVEQEDSESLPGFTIVCEETGEEFDSQEEFETHRLDLVREKALDELKDELSAIGFGDPESLHEPSKYESLEALTEAAVEKHSVGNPDIVPENARALAGRVACLIGRAHLNNTYKQSSVGE